MTKYGASRTGRGVGGASRTGDMGAVGAVGAVGGGGRCEPHGRGMGGSI